MSALQVRADQSKDASFFATKVLPVLETHCLRCHSHDAGKMKGGLTLDSKSGWASGGDSGSVITPGDPDKSLLISAVRYRDEFLQMPPKKKLSDEQIGVLVKWVKDGAVDPRKASLPVANDTDWWSLEKLESPKVPGKGHPIDAFIRQRLAEKGIAPSKPADRRVVARRLYIDLHGYQPTPEEVQAFVKNTDPKAYEELVDELLASPRYGERWARHWLDTIHFADSHGCEHDIKRPNAWRYRDYVIDRLNKDVPYSRFIREQLATDVFYPDQPELTPALGFISAGPLEKSRAGTAPVTFDYLDRDDMVTQTMAALTSTTANCARCHTHKFDPITQEDYYALQAVFAGVGKGDVEYEASPAAIKRRVELQALLDASNKQNADVLLQNKYTKVVNAWVAANQVKGDTWTHLKPESLKTTGPGTLNKQGDGSILAGGEVANQDTYMITSTVELKRLNAVLLEVLRDDRLPKGGPGRNSNGNMHLSEVQIQWLPNGETKAVDLKIVRAVADFDQVGWTSKHAIDKDLNTGWAIYPRVNESHQIVFVLDQPRDVSAGGKLVIKLQQLNPPKHLIGRFRLSVSDAANPRFLQHSPKVEKALSKSADHWNKEDQLTIAAAALSDYAKKQLDMIPAKAVTYAVSPYWSHDKKSPSPIQPKTVHLLRRGAIDQPIREVGPGAISAIEALPGRFKLSNPEQESQRRAALADWIVHDDNPLAWRSIVNRVWHYHFGKGLVDTPNDFGRMGSEPTHPELLDWLAVWFRDEAKGSLKELHKLILTSETWQQSSLAQTQADQPDHADHADNRLLWRMNRLRLDAETYRDSVLRMSGRLDLTMGGPGIEQFKKSKGPQFTPALDYNAYDWESPGANRRSIYRVVWRAIPDPFMEAMDFPDLGILAPKRGESLSALQSLVIYNNRFVLHGSKWTAERVQKEHASIEEQVRRAVELVWLRKPTSAEQAELVVYAKQHSIAALCRILLNSNEFFFVD